MELFKFSHGNAKLPDTTLIFSLPAGHTCPGAKDCLSRVNFETGRLEYGPHTIFGCYAASMELRPAVLAAHRHNHSLIEQHRKDQEALNTLLAFSLLNTATEKTNRVRWFESGDCYIPQLRDAIYFTAEHTPELTHYFYTKNLPLFTQTEPPSNVLITASWGGKYDHLIPEHFPRNSHVVFDEEIAKDKALPIDRDDSSAYNPQAQSFCHLHHGIHNPPGSEGQKAHQKRRKNGIFTGYSRTRKTNVDLHHSLKQQIQSRCEV